MITRDELEGQDGLKAVPFKAPDLIRPSLGRAEGHLSEWGIQAAAVATTGLR